MSVNRFTGRSRFLSNFYLCDVIGPGGYVYPSVEHAYQAAKCADRGEWTTFTSKWLTPAQAKRLGRKVKIREDWEAVKVGVMRELLFKKFQPGSELAANLCRTDGDLVEGNTWHDTFWGVDAATGEGFNVLGKLLMEVRDALLRIAGAACMVWLESQK